MENKVCCFIGHRKFKYCPSIESSLLFTIEDLITNKNVTKFLFGSKSEFNDYCYDLVSKFKEKYPHIKRVYVRSSFPDIDESYTNYLLESYEETFFPEHIRGSGKASYVERNQEMIDKSDICIFYYNPEYTPPKRKISKNTLTETTPKSGTKIAYAYAMKKNIELYNIFE